MEERACDRDEQEQGAERVPGDEEAWVLSAVERPETVRVRDRCQIDQHWQEEGGDHASKGEDSPEEGVQPCDLVSLCLHRNIAIQIATYEIMTSSTRLSISACQGFVWLLPILTGATAPRR